MEFLCDRTECTGCSACSNICRFDAILMKKDSNGFSYPYVDEKRCVHCGACSKVCHVVTPQNKYVPQSFFTYKGSDDERLRSSSGAFFPLIAKFFLNKGYHIVGVIFADDFLSTNYVVTQSLDVINDMRKSKYLEADVEDVYTRIKALLSSGEKVLFVGLPCQVAGLLKYTGANDRLITVDLICFGAGAPNIYKDCLMSFIKEKGYSVDDLRKIDFRHKPFIDNQHTVLDICVANEQYTLLAKQFPYYYGFVNQLIFREACYDCKYNCLERCSDITIGDYLGDSDVMGKNVVFANTKAGERIIEKLRNKAVIEEMNSEDIEKNKRRFVKKQKPVQYKKIMECKNYKRLERKYLTYPNNKSYTIRLKYFAKRFCR